MPRTLATHRFPARPAASRFGKAATINLKKIAVLKGPYHALFKARKAAFLRGNAVPKLLQETMRDPNLSASARVALFLLSSTRKRDGYSYLSNAQIGAWLGVTETQVSNIARELAQAELIRREGARGRGRRRWLILGLATTLLTQGLNATQAENHNPFGVQTEMQFADT